MKKYVLTDFNGVYKNNVNNSKHVIYAASSIDMIPLKNGDKFVTPLCFRKHSKRCSRCAFVEDFFETSIKKETNSIIVCLFWRIFYRRITWNSKK